MFRYETSSRVSFRIHSSILVAAFLCCLLWPAMGLAQSPDELAKSINSETRAAERAMHSGQNEKADSLLEHVQVMLQQLEEAAPGHTRIKGLQGKYERVRSQLDRKLKKSSSAPASAVSTNSPHTMQSDKLPGGVSKRIRDIDASLDKARGTLDNKSADAAWRIKQAGQYYAEAKSLLKEIDTRYGKDFSPDHPEYVAVKDRMDRISNAIDLAGKEHEQTVAATQATSARQEAQSRYWVERLAPFVSGPADPGYDPARYLVAGGTVNSAELNERRRIYTQAKETYDAYNAAEFPDGKTQELIRVEEKLAYALDTFEQAYQESLGLLAGDAGQQLDQALSFLSRTDWKDDPTVKPVVWNAERIDGLARSVAAYADSVQAGDARLEAMQDKLDTVRRLNEERRLASVDRTFMHKDVFSGNASHDIKSVAETAVRSEHPEAKLLRTSVISSDWKEERVLEYTDTTKTALQYRITRSVSAQVAAREQGVCSLYTLYVGSDRRSDGSWGPLRAHIMFTDEMLEENVNRSGP